MGGLFTPTITTGTFTGLSQALYPIDIGSNRKILDLGGDWKPASAFRLYADFSRQTRDGIDITSGSSYQQASFLPRYVDYETDQIDAGVQYGTHNASLTLAYYGSYFTNNNTSLTWETPFTTSPGATSLRMAREPDNDYQQISLSGKYRLSTWDTLLAFRVATGRGEQDEEFLPYTINPTIVTTPLPRTSLDGKVDTLHYAFTATAKPIRNGSVRFVYRYDERDNKTQVQNFWNRVIVDLLRSDELQENPDYSYDRMQVGISGEYVLKGVRLSAGYNYREFNRNLQEVSQQITDDGWGQVRWSPTGWLDLRIKGGASQRGIDNYDETIAAGYGQNPLMRKYTLAYRYRTYGEFIAAITPAASPVSFSFNFLFADDDYDGSLLGMIKSEEYSATADLSWAISESASAYLLYGYDSIEALQYGSEDFSFADWSANHDDTFDNFGVGFSWQPADSKFDFDVSYSRGDGETLIDVDSTSGGLSPLPALTSTLDSARLEASYAWTDRLDATLSFRWERFDLTDWALVSETTLPGILTMGAEPWDYDVYAVGIGIRYRFGVSEISLAD
jgi:MtrB/PioB family decaheme-associated outer membrane protein